AGHDLQLADLGRGLGPAVRLHVGHHHVGAPGGPAAALVEHGVRLADPRRGAEVDPQGTPTTGLSWAHSHMLPPPGRHPSHSRTCRTAGGGGAERLGDEMRRLPIRFKLVAALTVPLLGLLAVVVAEVVRTSQDVRRVRDQAAMATAAIGPSGLMT